ncbi:immunity 49 family protein [Streptomyces sp. HUAS TT20]|uniref:immunity 49 family protein n=1 Tax=Streptomyces sp. HUAS TT20 TaxID=3447509 RepID=UPI0021DA6B5E|nr:immunity 49 family protein [Streptomyces sp. HUAS 15-9]UXY27680.1 immunity 49 family protein [Streptomyces sp. HUAS 15-9]
MFDLALSKAMTHVQARLAVNPDASELATWEAVVTAMQVSSAMFAAARETEGVIECRIDDRTRAIPATGPQPYIKAGNWLTAFWLSIVCREQARMTLLCNVSIDTLRASGTEYDEYVYHWIDSLQTYWLERPGLGGKLIAAIQTSSPEVSRVADRDLLDKILYQPISLFHQFLRKDHAGFNQALLEALELHKAFWTATDERERTVEGYVALGPLAIACLAYDAGFPIDVESDYIPGELLNRAWLGEFPT